MTSWRRLSIQDKGFVALGVLICAAGLKVIIQKKAYRTGMLVLSGLSAQIAGALLLIWGTIFVYYTLRKAFNANLNKDEKPVITQDKKRNK